MSDINPETDDVSEQFQATLVEAAKPPLSSAAREPSLARTMEEPPAAAPQTPVMEVVHTRIGGTAGVRVQQLGGVTRVKGATADVLESTTVRLPQDVLDALKAELKKAHAALEASKDALQNEKTFEGLRAAVARALEPTV